MRNAAVDGRGLGGLMKLKNFACTKWNRLMHNSVIWRSFGGLHPAMDISMVAEKLKTYVGSQGASYFPLM